MIQLTRLRHGETFYLNPDLFERVDTHVDTVIRLTDGTEYVVVEPADEIVGRIVEYRARIIAIAGVLQSGAFGPNGQPPEHAWTRHAGELGIAGDDATPATADQVEEPS